MSASVAPAATRDDVPMSLIILYNTSSRLFRNNTTEEERLFRPRRQEANKHERIVLCVYVYNFHESRIIYIYRYIIILLALGSFLHDALYV